MLAHYRASTEARLVGTHGSHSVRTRAQNKGLLPLNKNVKQVLNEMPPLASDSCCTLLSERTVMARLGNNTPMRRKGGQENGSDAQAGRYMPKLQLARAKADCPSRLAVEGGLRTYWHWQWKEEADRDENHRVSENGSGQTGTAGVSDPVKGCARRGYNS
jgi:hypothetical protein